MRILNISFMIIQFYWTSLQQALFVPTNVVQGRVTFNAIDLPNLQTSGPGTQYVTISFSRFNTVPQFGIWIIQDYTTMSLDVYQIIVKQITTTDATINIVVAIGSAITNITLQWIASTNPNVYLFLDTIQSDQSITNTYTSILSSPAIVISFVRATNFSNTPKISQVSGNTTNFVYSLKSTCIWNCSTQIQSIAFDLDPSLANQTMLYYENFNTSVGLVDYTSQYYLYTYCNNSILTQISKFFITNQGCADIQDYQNHVQLISLQVATNNNQISINIGYFTILQLNDCQRSSLSSCQTCTVDYPKTFYQLKYQCNCQAGYYDNLSNCQACDPTCLTCVNLQTQCTACDTNLHRVFNSKTNSCDCLSGFATQNNLCSSCHPSCLTCSGSSNSQCVSCNSNLQRIINSNQCICTQFYFQNSSQICQICDYSCWSCSTSTSCSNCSLVSHHRGLSLQTNLCACITGYFDTGTGLPICQQCQTPCLSCQGTPDRCLSCIPSAGRSCLCKAGYFPDSSDKCFTCNLSCQTCFDEKVSSCLSCYSFQKRALQNNVCQCQESYYEDQDLQSCYKCHFSCLDCTGQSQFQCTRCRDVSTSFRFHKNQQCKCLAGYLQIQNSAACLSNNQLSQLEICPKGQYEYKLDNTCRKCHPICATCSGESPLECSSCKTGLLVQPKITPAGNQSQFILNELRFTGDIEIFNCQNSEVLIAQPDREVILTWSFYNQNDGSIAMQKTELYNGISNFNIPPMTGQVGQIYSVDFKVKFNESEETYLDVIKITYLTSKSKVIIKGGDRVVGQNSNFSLQVEIYNIDISTSPLQFSNTSSIFWNCTNLATSKPCRDHMGIPITLQNGSSQQFQSRQFPIYSANLFIIDYVDWDHRYMTSDHVTIYIVEDNVPVLNFKFNPLIIFEEINLNADITFDFVAEPPGDSDSNYYQSNLIYNSESVQSMQFHYLKMSFNVNDHFSGFMQDKGNILILRGSLLNPNYFLAAKTTLQLKVNLPPSQCLIKIFTLGGQDFDQLYRISIYSCVDFDQPLSYSYSYYESELDQQQDILSGIALNAIAITDFIDQPYLDVILPFSINDSLPPILIMVKIRDSKGGISNITQTFKPINFNQNKKLNVSQLILLGKNLKLSYLQVISPLIKTFEDSEELLQLKLLLLDGIKNLQSKNLLKSQQNQISQANAYLLYNQDILDGIDLDEYITEMINQSNQTAQDQILIIETSQKFAMSTSLQEAKNDNIIFSQRLGQILSSIQKKFSDISYQKVDPNWKTQFIDEKQQLFAQSVNNKMQKFVETIIDIIAGGMIPNQSPLQMNYPNFNYTISYLTQKGLSKIRSVSQTHSRLLNTLEKSKEKLGKTKFYSYRLASFSSNPKQSNSNYPYKNQRTSLKYVSIQDHMTDQFDITTKNPNDYVNTDWPAFMLFQKLSNSSNDVCISQNQSGWSNIDCITVISNDSIKCSCDKVTFYSVIDDTKFLFSINPNIFTELALIKSLQFSWYKVTLFYGLISLTSIFVLLTIWGIYQDDKDRKKIQPHCITELQLVPQFQVKEIQLFRHAKNNRFFRKQSRSSQLTNTINLSNISESKQMDSSDRNVTISPDRNTRYSPEKRFRHSPDRRATISEEKKITLFPDQGIDITASCETTQRSKIVSTAHIKVIETKQEITFSRYLLENHDLSNIIYVYNPTLSRPLRASILYSSYMMSLMFSIMYGINLQYERVIILACFSTFVDLITTFWFLRSIGSENTILKIFGLLTFVSSNTFQILMILFVVSQTLSTDQVNIWTFHYSIQILINTFIFKVLLIKIQYLCKKQQKSLDYQQSSEAQTDQNFVLAQ